MIDSMRVLVVDDDEDVRLAVRLCLEKQCHANVVEVQSGHAAAKLLQSDAHFDCIVSDYSMPDGTGGDLFKSLKAVDSKIPFVLHTKENLASLEEFKNEEVAGLIHKQDTAYVLPPIIQSLKHFSNEFIPNPDYIQLEIPLFEKIDILPCSVFIKLSDNKYIRRYQAGDSIDSSDISSLSKKVKFLHIEDRNIERFLRAFLRTQISREDLKQFESPEDLLEISRQIENGHLRKQIVSLSTCLKSSLEKELDLSASVKVSLNTHQVVKKAINRFGITQDVQQLIKANVRLSLETIAASQVLPDHLLKMLKNENTYINSHSVILSHNACMIANALGWTSNLTRYKLCLASFLHDITLESHELAQIQNLGDLMVISDRFSQQELVECEEHPVRSADFALQIRLVPPDVDEIIRQHHERPDGSGFPKGLKATDLHPLSCIFIAGHDLTNYIRESYENWSMEEFLKDQMTEYSHGLFAKILKGLEKNLS